MYFAGKHSSALTIDKRTGTLSQTGRFANPADVLQINIRVRSLLDLINIFVWTYVYRNMVLLFYPESCVNWFHSKNIIYKTIGGRLLIS